MTVGQLMRVIDSRELSEWMAYDRINTAESWQQTAQICHVIESNLRKKPRKFEAFLPRKIRPRSEAISPASIRARLAPFRSPSRK